MLLEINKTHNSNNMWSSSMKFLKENKKGIYFICSQTGWFDGSVSWWVKEGKVSRFPYWIFFFSPITRVFFFFAIDSEKNCCRIILFPFSSMRSHTHSAWKIKKIEGSFKSVKKISFISQKFFSSFFISFLPSNTLYFLLVQQKEIFHVIDVGCS
jgi:hypothetical protein